MKKYVYVVVDGVDFSHNKVFTNKEKAIRYAIKALKDVREYEDRYIIDTDLSNRAIKEYFKDDRNIAGLTKKDWCTNFNDITILYLPIDES